MRKTNRGTIEMTVDEYGGMFNKKIREIVEEHNSSSKETIKAMNSLDNRLTKVETILIDIRESTKQKNDGCLIHSKTVSEKFTSIRKDMVAESVRVDHRIDAVEKWQSNFDAVKNVFVWLAGFVGFGNICLVILIIIKYFS